jgi:hypothetical protein
VFIDVLLLFGVRSRERSGTGFGVKESHGRMELESGGYGFTVINTKAFSRNFVDLTADLNSAADTTTMSADNWYLKK